MLKPAEERMPEPGDERPVGEIVSELIEDGKAYARAEVNLYRAIAAAKARALAMPAALFLGALLVAQSAITALAVAVVLWLEPMVGPVLAGIVALLLFGAAAGGLAWLGLARIREALE
jgi:hypothetical protein